MNKEINMNLCVWCPDLIVYRARRSEARIQQMLWKINYSDVVFVNTVCLTFLLIPKLRS